MYRSTCADSFMMANKYTPARKARRPRPARPLSSSYAMGARSDRLRHNSSTWSRIRKRPSRMPCREPPTQPLQSALASIYRNMDKSPPPRRLVFRMPGKEPSSPIQNPYPPLCVESEPLSSVFWLLPVFDQQPVCLWPQPGLFLPDKFDAVLLALNHDSRSPVPLSSFSSAPVTTNHYLEPFAKFRR